MQQPAAAEPAAASATPVSSSEPSLGVIPLPRTHAAQVRSGASVPGQSRISIELATRTELDALTWLLPEAVVAGLEKQRETHYTLAPDALRWLFEHAEVVLNGLIWDWSPAHQPQSIVLAEIRVDSLADRLGLEAGDRVVALDGVAPAGAEAVAAALHHARERGTLVIDLERGGERWSLTVSVSAAGSQQTQRLQR